MALAACALLAGGASACRAGAQSEVVATYKGGTITADDYQGWLSFAKLDDDPAQRKDRLRQIALARILSAALLARGGDRDPAVAGQLADVEDRVLFLALGRRLAAEVRVTEADVDKALRENEKDRHQPRRVQLANLFKKVPRDASPAQRQAARARIEELRRQILAGADFSELARRESDSQTRFRGGRMGIAWPGQLPPHLEKVAFQLSEGQVSEVLEHADGFTLLKCLHVLPEQHHARRGGPGEAAQAPRDRGGKRRLEEVVSAALARWPMVVVDLSGGGHPDRAALPRRRPLRRAGGDGRGRLPLAGRRAPPAGRGRPRRARPAGHPGGSGADARGRPAGGGAGARDRPRGRAPRWRAGGGYASSPPRR